MANLTYSNIFTKVNKWDEQYTYLGIQVSGKLTQYNGQDYSILDAIDIDWNGAYVEKLNTYVYTTEDLIKLFNKLGQADIDINSNLLNNYVTNIKLNSSIENASNIINQRIDDLTLTIEDTILENILNRYEFLNALSEVLIDKTKYLQIDYSSIVNENGEFTQYAQDREFYIYDDVKNIFSPIDKNYILYHPNREYYIFLINDIIKLNNNVEDIFNIIGTQNYNQENSTYTYTGFYQNFHEIDVNLTYISYYLDNNTTTTTEAYYYGYTGYTTSNYNTYLIGHHTQYNVYEKVDINSNEFNNYLNSNSGNIFIKNPNDETTYLSIHYSGNPNYEYYILHNTIPATGIEKEIEDIQKDIVDNSYLLYHLSIESKDDNIISKITPEDTINKPKDRKIILDLRNSIIDPITGEISIGLINDENLRNGVSYLFDWKIIE